MAGNVFGIVHPNRNGCLRHIVEWSMVSPRHITAGWGCSMFKSSGGVVREYCSDVSTAVLGMSSSCETEICLVLRRTV